VESGDLFAAAEQKGLSRLFLDRAARDLGIVKKCVPPGPWYWCAIGQEPLQNPAAVARREDCATAAQADAMAWLAEYLRKKGPMRFKAIVQAGKEEGYSRTRLVRIRESAGVLSTGTRRAEWYLPEQLQTMPAAEKRGEGRPAPGFDPWMDVMKEIASNTRPIPDLATDVRQAISGARLRRPVDQLNDAERVILSAMPTEGGTSTEEISAETGYTGAHLRSLLAALVRHGYAASTPQGYVRLAEI
jgi:hypothetical protein